MIYWRRCPLIAASERRLCPYTGHMMKLPSRDYQYKAVSAGIALGLCMLEQYTVPGAKLPLESAFRRSWRRWAHKEQFPSIGKVFDLGVPTVDPYIALTSNNQRTQTPRVPFYWDRGGLGYKIYSRSDDGWNPFEDSEADFVAGLISEDPTIPATAWEALARDILAELADNE